MKNKYFIYILLFILSIGCIKEFFVGQERFLYEILNREYIIEAVYSDVTPINPYVVNYTPTTIRFYYYSPKQRKAYDGLYNYFPGRMELRADATLLGIYYYVISDDLKQFKIYSSRIENSLIGNVPGTIQQYPIPPYTYGGQYLLEIWDIIKIFDKEIILKTKIDDVDYEIYIN